MASIDRFDGEDDKIILLPCPFCGEEPIMETVGNDYTRKRSLVIKCSNVDCRATMTNGAILHGFRWLEDVSIEAWNRRAP